MNANERFEYMAEQFYRKTGMLAPGKDDPLCHGEDYLKNRIAEWYRFAEEFHANLFQTHTDMYEMLEECKSILEGNTYFVKAEKIELLLKRARGE